MLCPAVNLGRGAFEAMAHVVSLVHRSLEAAQDARGHCPLLAAYVHYAFRLPGTEPNFPSGKCWWEALGGAGNIREESVPVRGNGMCKGPEAVQALAGLGSLQERSCGLCCLTGGSFSRSTSIFSSLRQRLS